MTTPDSSPSPAATSTTPPWRSATATTNSHTFTPSTWPATTGLSRARTPPFWSKPHRLVPLATLTEGVTRWRQWSRAQTAANGASLLAPGPVKELLVEQVYRPGSEADSVSTQPNPTHIQGLWIASLRGLYHDEELTEEERERAITIAEDGEPMHARHDGDFVILGKYMREERNHRDSLSVIFETFEQYRQQGGELDEWHFLLMAETCEVQRLFADKEEPESALIRASSFLENYFESNLPWREYMDDDFDPEEDDISLAKLINIALYEDRISQEERMLLHFIRQCRNLFAHRSWLRNENFDLVVLANRVTLYVLDQLLQQAMAQHDIGDLDNMITDTVAQSYVEEIEEVHGWEYLDREYWEVP